MKVDQKNDEVIILPVLDNVGNPYLRTRLCDMINNSATEEEKKIFAKETGLIRKRVGDREIFRVNRWNDINGVKSKIDKRG